jgi:rhamnogalacturonan endolyase
MNACAMIASVVFLVLLASSAPGDEAQRDVVLLEDDFEQYRAGLFFPNVGAHTEYHYLPEAGPKGNWAVSTFRSEVASQRAWRVIREDGVAIMAQMYKNKWRHCHPMLVAGDPLWNDYVLEVRFAPQSDEGQSGIVFRYRNDRCYYFFGVDGDKAVLKMVRNATAFRKPHDQMLGEAACAWTPGEYLDARVSVLGAAIRCELGNGAILEAEDDTYETGRVALMADIPTHYAHVRVIATDVETKRVHVAMDRREREQLDLQAANPRPVLWQKVSTKDFGVGRNLRFGDLTGNGQPDVLVGQVRHHGPKDRNSELSCLTALTFDGDILWQIGEPDPWKNHLTNDVGFQIHDIDGDGRNEVVYCMHQEIIVADGATGKTRLKAPTPATPQDTPAPYNRFPRILGDSLFFCDLRGLGRPGDIIIKDRYRSLWALNDHLEILWHAQCTTGHYPFAYDVDGDGKDELAVGYSLFDHDGKRLWSLDDVLKDHADGVAIVRFHEDPDEEPRIMCAASDEGMFFADIRGSILKHHYLGHVQNPAVANFRPDLPGLETVSINFWGNQGIIHFFDANGDLYHDFEPCQHGSMCLPINWTGQPGEFFVLSANVEEGGMFDGWGRKVVTFPADGHPDMCYAVLDVTGDCRDEVVVWDPHEIWVYTQDDNPKPGKLYKPVRNPLYNHSNYQATVSLPGWED